MKSVIGRVGLVACALVASVLVLPWPKAAALGSLTITTPGSANLGSAVVSPGSKATGTLAGTTVADTRATLLGWTATVIASTDFTYYDSLLAVTRTISTASPSPLDWKTTNLRGVGGALLNGVTVPGAGNVSKTVPLIAVTAALGFGGGTYSYDAALTFTVPANAYAGTYRATLVQSVS